MGEGMNEIRAEEELVEGWSKEVKDQKGTEGAIISGLNDAC